MERQVQQLVEMVSSFEYICLIALINVIITQGATPAQARAALKKCSDVMQAAEQIFEGRFDDVVEDEVADTESLRNGRSQVEANHRLAVSSTHLYCLFILISLS